MTTAKLISRDFRGTAVLDHESGVRMIVADDGTLVGLAAAAYEQEQARVVNEAKRENIPIGTIITLAPRVSPLPTREEQDRAAFFADVQSYRQQQKYDALPAELKARCLPEYVMGL